MINVLLADDHQLFLDGLNLILEKDPKINVVGEALDGNQVLEKLEDLKVDVVVLDIDMPNLNGVETTQFIRKKYPEVKILIVSNFNKKQQILTLMKYGAYGYVLKNKSKEELLFAIHNVFRGQPHFGLEILKTAQSVSDSFVEDGTLTDREIEVMCKIAEGFTSKQAGKLLNISEKTVDTHRRNILNKLNLPNLAHLVRYAIKHEYVKL